MLWHGGLSRMHSAGFHGRFHGLARMHWQRIQARFRTAWHLAGMHGRFHGFKRFRSMHGHNHNRHGTDAMATDTMHGKTGVIGTDARQVSRQNGRFRTDYHNRQGGFAGV